ncbi:hypothetical protein Godav_029627 [Gossypium davidsonii]|uniref:K Homology domain-containing protein n=2 Tax=Gossypium TaxID=3633 RepID=A0A7J8T925_GOSDV|nr:hypothetical protein [Gossypium davidsonii]
MYWPRCKRERPDCTCHKRERIYCANIPLRENTRIPPSGSGRAHGRRESTASSLPHSLPFQIPSLRLFNSDSKGGEWLDRRTHEGLIDDEFNESKEEMFDFDVYDSDMSSRIRVNLDGLNMDDIEVGELCDSDDSERLNNAHESNSDDQNWPEFNPDNDISNLKLQMTIEVIRMSFNGIPMSYSNELLRFRDGCLDLEIKLLFVGVILGARGKSILTIMKTIKTKIILLIVKNKEEAEKIKGILPPKIKKKLDVNMKNSLRSKDTKLVFIIKVAPIQQEATPTHQQSTPTYQQVAAPREKLLLKRKPTTVRWMSSTQESFVSDPSMTL